MGDGWWVPFSPWLSKVGQMSLFYQPTIYCYRQASAGHLIPAELPETRQGDHTLHHQEPLVLLHAVT